VFPAATYPKYCHKFYKTKQTFYSIISITLSIFKEKISLWGLLIKALTDIQLAFKMSSIKNLMIALK
jgi:hypothetical protein